MFLSQSQSDPITILVDILFLSAICSFTSWYFIVKLKKNLIGGFFISVILSAVGSILIVAIFQNFFRSLVMWFMSPKLGNFQFSNLNLILVFISSYTVLYLISVLQNKKPKK
jgi:hypothetical protein